MKLKCPTCLQVFLADPTTVRAVMEVPNQCFKCPNGCILDRELTLVAEREAPQYDIKFRKDRPGEGLFWTRRES